MRVLNEQSQDYSLGTANKIGEMHTDRKKPGKLSAGQASSTAIWPCNEQRKVQVESQCATCQDSSSSRLLTCSE